MPWVLSRNPDGGATRWRYFEASGALAATFNKSMMLGVWLQSDQNDKRHCVCFAAEPAEKVRVQRSSGYVRKVGLAAGLGVTEPFDECHVGAGASILRPSGLTGVSLRFPACYGSPLHQMNGTFVPLRVLVSPKKYLARATKYQIAKNKFNIVLAEFETVDLADFDAVIPTTQSEIALVRARRAAGQSIRAIIPDAAVEALCHDKFAFNQTLIATGFANEIPRLLPDDAEPPFILKRSDDSFGENSHLVMTEADLARLASLHCHSGYFRQAYVHDPMEYAAHFLLKDGVVRYHSLVEYDMGAAPYLRNSETRGITLRRNLHSPYYDTLLAILRAVKFTEGICCFDYKVQAGRLQVLELNPRFGGSLAGSFQQFVTAYVAELGPPNK